MAVMERRADRQRQGQRQGLRRRPVQPLGMWLATLAGLVGTACALISRRPAPSPLGGATGGLPSPLLARALQYGRRHLPAAAAVAGGGNGRPLWMTALQPERPQVQQERGQQHAGGSAWYHPRLVSAEGPAEPQQQRVALRRPAPTQAPIDLQDPNVEVAIRPATAEEIAMVVDLRHDVFSACCALGKEEEAAAVAQWKERSLANLLNRRAKGAVLLVATARDRRWGADAAPVLVGSVEYSHHEFRETGFSPILAGGLYCEEDGEDEEHCYLFDDDEDEEQEWSSWGDVSRTLHRRASTSFRRPASRLGGGGASDGGGYGDKLYVTGVMVANCCRRQGLGASLLRSVEEHARVLRTPYICMFVEPSNTPALELYTRRAGFHMVPYSPTAEAFAAAIGLYKGPHAARQYIFVYKRLELDKEAAAAGQQEQAAGGLLADAEAAARPFPGRMPALGSSFLS